MRVFVAGASGVIGRRLVPSLVEAGHDVTGMTRSPDKPEALRRLPANVFGVLMSLEPAVAAVAGLLVLGERLSARVVASIALVVVASAGAALGARDPELPPDV